MDTVVTDMEQSPEVGTDAFVIDLVACFVCMVDALFKCCNAWSSRRKRRKLIAESEVLCSKKNVSSP